MDQYAIREFLTKVELFEHFEELELDLVSQLMNLKEIKKNTLLFSENMERNHVYMILEGEVELFQRTPFGQERRLSFFSKFDFLGEGSLIDDSPHSTSARALLDTKVIYVKCSKLNDLLRENGNMAVKLYSKISEVISRRLRRTNTRAANIGAQYDSGQNKKRT